MTAKNKLKTVEWVWGIAVGGIVFRLAYALVMFMINKGHTITLLTTLLSTVLAGMIITVVMFVIAVHYLNKYLDEKYETTR